MKYLKDMKLASGSGDAKIKIYLVTEVSCLTLNSKGLLVSGSYDKIIKVCEFINFTNG